MAHAWLNGNSIEVSRAKPFHLLEKDTQNADIELLKVVVF